MRELRIRRATLRDVRRMAEIEQACFEKAYPEALLALFVTSERYISLVAEVGGVSWASRSGSLRSTSTSEWGTSGR